MYKNLNKESEKMLKEQKIESGRRLKQCRIESGITQKEFAKRANYSVQQICYIENGKRGMSEESARIFGKLLNVRPEYLLAKDDSKTLIESIVSRTESILTPYKRENLIIDSLNNYVSILCHSISYKFKGKEGLFSPYTHALKGNIHNPLWKLISKDGREDEVLMESVHISLEEKEFDVKLKDYYCFLDSIIDYIKFRLENLEKYQEKSSTYDLVFEGIELAHNKGSYHIIFDKYGADSRCAEEFLRMSLDNDADDHGKE